jgi:hypothetical protein
MFSKKLCLLVAAVMMWPCVAPAGFAQATQPPSPQQQAQAEKIKRRVADWGVLKQVTVKLASGEKLKGRVTEIEADFFTLRLEDRTQGATRDVRYAEVKSISAKREGAGQAVSRVLFGPAGVGGAIMLGVLVAVTLAAASQRR